MDDERLGVADVGEVRQKLHAFDELDARCGASPRAVLGHNDYQQLTSAAIAGDAAMFLGGNWQLASLREGLPPAEFAKFQADEYARWKKVIADGNITQ